MVAFILSGSHTAWHTLGIVEVLVEERLVGEEKGSKWVNTPQSENIQSNR